MAAPRPRLVITEPRPYVRWLLLLGLLAWMGSVLLAYNTGARRAAPDAAQLRSALAELQEEHAAARQRVERLSQKVATLERSEQVERDAARALQQALVERDAELAGLRNDVAFYERLAGGDGERRALSVHSLSFVAAGEGGWRYVLTLTQNLKKAAISKGEVSLSVEGSQDGKLRTLQWPELTQGQGADALPFSFKYFQQLEGSVALPAGFVPHRVRVSIRSNQGQSEQVLPWQDDTTQGVS